jgi:hypothetical protein
MRETRSQIIAEHALLAMRRSAMTERTYAESVAEVYQERTPLHLRTVQFASSADPYADTEANRQTVKRMLDGRVRMAVDLEEALILALPQPYREHLIADLAARLGLRVAAAGSATAAGQQHQVGDLIRTAGEAVQTLSTMLDDGVLDERDAPHAAAALRDLAALGGRVATLEDAIRRYVLASGGSLAETT